MMSPINLVTVLVCILLCQMSCMSATTTTTTTVTNNTTTPSTATMTMTSTSNNTSNVTLTTAATITTVTTTTTTTTTTKSPFDVNHNTELALYVLKLTVGPGNNSDIQYQNTNLTRQELLSQLSPFFSNFSFGVGLLPNSTANQTMEPFILRVEFMIKNPNSTEELQRNILNALTLIDNSPGFIVPSSNATNEAVSQFISNAMDICFAENVCPLGFTCNAIGCQHLCRTQDCNNHGTCYATVDSRAVVTTLCQCDSEYATEYMGDKCQYSRRGRLEIIAIIAGVLGAACLIFIIVIIVLCVMRGRHKSSSNYNLQGASYANNAYDNSRQK